MTAESIRKCSGMPESSGSESFVAHH